MNNLVNPDRRDLGRFTVGPLAFGCWRFVNMETARARAVIEAALEAGMNLIDTADVYGLDWGGTGFGEAEALLGKVLADAPGLRERIVLATKGGIAPPTPYDSSADYLRRACEASLSRMNVDTLDLYQIHRPDMYTHPAELAAVLSELRKAGKVREVGVSNHTPAQTRALQAHLDFRIASTQPEFSAAHLAPLRDGTLDLAMEMGFAVLAWSPLAGGKLATGETGPRVELLAALDRLAAREGVDRAAVAIAFVIAHPSRPVAILGTQKAERLAGAQRALTVKLDRKDVYDLVQAHDGVPLP